MRSVRTAVIGAGAVAPSHCEGIIKHPSAELTAIVDTHEGRAAELQKRYGVPRVYHTVEDCLRDSDIDAVSVALPTYLHAVTAIQALESGKHVLLDKPFAMNEREAAQVVEIARLKNRVLTVGMNRRFMRESQTMKTIVSRGDLGEIYHAKAYWNRRSGCPVFGTWFVNKRLSGGGVLLDIGVHLLDLSLWLIGSYRAKSVFGSVYTKFGNRNLGQGTWGKSDPEGHVFDVDDLAAAFIKLDNGTSVILEVSWARHQADPNYLNVELFGTRAGGSVYPPRVCRDASSDGEYEVVEPQGVAIRHAACNRMANWIDAILGVAEIECKPEESLQLQRILDAIYRSSETGKEVSLNEE